MRVIAGIYGSRVLRSLKGLALRPTSDRLRETLFNVIGPAVEGARFLDLYSGTGAVGIEALSRGAREVVFVEKHLKAVALIRRNLASLGIANASVLALDAMRGLLKLSGAKSRPAPAFDYVFLDPPYDLAEEYQRVLDYLGSVPLVAEDGRVIAEHRSKIELPARPGFLVRYRVLKQGDAALSFYRQEAAEDEEIAAD